VVLGLRASAQYSLAVEAFGAGGSVSIRDSLLTSPLPSAIPIAAPTRHRKPVGELHTRRADYQ
jgi:hypothetical protein